MMAAAETQTYAYNMRDELVSGQGNAYAYDDIGNRTVAEGHVYGSNALNQYVAIDAFQPSYDLDGNQTLVRTSTGDWTVAYNAENRPVAWTKGDTVVTMVYDRLGRRVECKEVVGGATVKHERFVYNGYTCVQRLRADGTVSQLFVWDPTEPVATRPLYMQVPDWGANLFYACDGNKNVSDVFYRANVNGIAAHYDYAPFGAVTRTARNTQVTHRNFIELNPWRFSSEFYDDTLGLVYYNYRHYNPQNGRWTGRDPLDSRMYVFVGNSPLGLCDVLGLLEKEKACQLIVSCFNAGVVIKRSSGEKVLLRIDPMSILSDFFRKKVEDFVLKKLEDMSPVSFQNLETISSLFAVARSDAFYIDGWKIICHCDFRRYVLGVFDKVYEGGVRFDATSPESQKWSLQFPRTIREEFARTFQKLAEDIREYRIELEEEACGCP